MIFNSIFLLSSTDVVPSTDNLSSCTTPSSKSSTSGEFLLPNDRERITNQEIIDDQIEIVPPIEFDDIEM